jgi:hypothetical protein
VTALLPADGASLPVDPSGIELRYTCPLFIFSGEPPFAVYGSRRDYGVLVADQPTLANDGRLLQSNWIDFPPSDDVEDNDLPQDQCRTFFHEDNHHLTPRVYYWQAFRICVACPGGYDTSEVRSFRLTASGSGTRLSVALPKRAYGGIPFHARVGGRALPTFGRVKLQARSGSRGAWRTILGLQVLTDSQTQESSAVGPAKLPSGSYQVRASMRLGTESITSPVRKLRVLRVKGWPRANAGRWREPNGLRVSFTVSPDGRTLRGGSFGVLLICPQVPLPGGQGQTTTVVAEAPLPKAKLAPDGSFAWAGTVNRHNVYVYGRVRGGRASGRVTLGLGACRGGQGWRAVKRGSHAEARASATGGRTIR